jgi:hypothetical protein
MGPCILIQSPLNQPTRCNSFPSLLLDNICGSTCFVRHTPVIWSTQLNPQPLVLHTLQVEGRNVVGHGQTEYSCVVPPHDLEHTTAPAASGFAYIAG